MMLRTIALAVAAYVLLAPAALPAYADLGGAQHAQRVVAELALRQAQAKAAAKCEATTLRRLPTYPPVGTIGPIRVPMRARDCPHRLPR